MHGDVRYRREVLGHKVPEPEVLELVVMGLEVAIPGVQADEVYAPGNLKAVVLPPEDPAETELPEVGSFSGLMAKMEGKIRRGKIAHHALNKLGRWTPS